MPRAHRAQWGSTLHKEEELTHLLSNLSEDYTKRFFTQLQLDFLRSSSMFAINHRRMSYLLALLALPVDILQDAFVVLLYARLQSIQLLPP